MSDIPAEEMERLFRETQRRQEREAKAAKRTSIGNRITIAGLLVVVVVEGLAIAALAPTVRVVPLIAVPQPDGSMVVVAHGDALPAAVQERAIRATLFQYVRLREGWSSGEAGYAYDVVSRMSAKVVRSAFQDWFNLPKAPGPQAVYGTTAVATVRQLSSELLPNTTAQPDGSYKIWFRKTEFFQNRAPVETDWTVTLRYRTGQPIAGTDGVTVNPLGVIVTEYRPPERSGVALVGASQ